MKVTKDQGYVICLAGWLSKDQNYLEGG